MPAGRPALVQRVIAVSVATVPVDKRMWLSALRYCCCTRCRAARPPKRSSGWGACMPTSTSSIEPGSTARGWRCEHCGGRVKLVEVTRPQG
eukprot:CAMPEP_0177632990 /NCGR_PEP_ID=MMETSP0447-20121125/2596_1 /TAXON_ID=0 /ORGANISM="Stygamoeba regulata, Strain BSH-02190019" /LENGTH=90 /DNA_ID=CAMNT_0019134615 /DNA_START=1161 /DNA_END=1433 /DNA_ORIENTATION=+